MQIDNNYVWDEKSHFRECEALDALQSAHTLKRAMLP